MGAGVNFVIRFAYPSPFVNEVANAPGIGGLGVITGTIGEAHLAPGVTEKAKREVLFLGKSGIVLHAIKANAQHLNIEILKIADLVAEPASLRGSARGVGHGIEPEKHLLAFKAGKREVLTGMGLDGKVRSRITNFEHIPTSLSFS
jgi:hypothetical protein